MKNAFSPRNIMGDLVEARRQSDGTYLAQIDVEKWSLDEIADSIDYLLNHPDLKIKSIHGSGFRVDVPSEYKRKSSGGFPDMLYVTLWKL